MSKEILSFSYIDIKPQVIVKSENNWIYSLDGNKYFDSMSCLWSMPLGYSCVELKEVLLEQMGQSICYHNFFNTQNESSLSFVNDLSNHFDHEIFVYFSNSGSMANETALTLAYRYIEKKDFKRKIILSLDYGYHGSSLLTSYVSSQSMERFSRFEINNFNKKTVPIKNEDGSYSLQKLINAVSIRKDVGIVIIEPCIGAGGVYPFSPRELDDLIRVCRSKNIITIFDEIITAFGMSETAFYIDQCEEKPDFITLGKAMTNGYFPYSATILFNEKIKDTFKWFNYGFTFSSHPIGSALASKMLKIIKSGKYRSNYLLIDRKLESIIKNSNLKEVRKNGLMLGFELKDHLKVEDIEKKARESGFILSGGHTNPQTICACLPLSAREEDYDYFFEKLNRIL